MKRPCSFTGGIVDWNTHVVFFRAIGLKISTFILLVLEELENSQRMN